MHPLNPNVDFFWEPDSFKELASIKLIFFVSEAIMREIINLKENNPAQIYKVFSKPYLLRVMGNKNVLMEEPIRLTSVPKPVTVPLMFVGNSSFFTIKRQYFCLSYRLLDVYNLTKCIVSYVKQG